MISIAMFGNIEDQFRYKVWIRAKMQVKYQICMDQVAYQVRDQVENQVADRVENAAVFPVVYLHILQSENSHENR